MAPNTAGLSATTYTLTAMVRARGALRSDRTDEHSVPGNARAGNRGSRLDSHADRALTAYVRKNRRSCEASGAGLEAFLRLPLCVGGTRSGAVGGGPI